MSSTRAARHSRCRMSAVSLPVLCDAGGARALSAQIGPYETPCTYRSRLCEIQLAADVNLMRFPEEQLQTECSLRFFQSPHLTTLPFSHLILARHGASTQTVRLRWQPYVSSSRHGDELSFLKRWHVGGPSSPSIASRSPLRAADSDGLADRRGCRTCFQGRQLTPKDKNRIPRSDRSSSQTLSAVHLRVCS